MIDTILAIIAIAVLIAIFKFGGAIIEYFVNKVRGNILEKKYPLLTQDFPIDAMRRGDCVSISNLGEGMYRDKSDGKYYVECVKGKFADGSSYIYADKDFLNANCSKLYNKHVVKWQKNQ